MKVDLPITILFDNQGELHNIKHKVTCTLRFDTDLHVDDKVEIFDGYPPRNEKMGEDGEGAMAMLGMDAWIKLKSKIERWPEDYCTDIEEGERLQAEVDEEIAQDSQFGHGA